MRSTSNRKETLLNNSTTYEEAGEGITRDDYLRHAVQVVTSSAIPVVIEATVDGTTWFQVGEPITGASLRFLEGWFPYLRARRTDTGVDPAPAVSVVIESGVWVQNTSSL